MAGVLPEQPTHYRYAEIPHADVVDIPAPIPTLPQQESLGRLRIEHVSPVALHKTSLRQHRHSVHNAGEPRATKFCFYENCPRSKVGFSRRDNWRTHMEKVHGLKRQPVNQEESKPLDRSEVAKLLVYKPFRTFEEWASSLEDAAEVLGKRRLPEISTPLVSASQRSAFPETEFELLERKIRQATSSSPAAQISRRKVVSLYKSFRHKAKQAYEKLTNSPDDSTDRRSPGLISFISSLNSVDDIIKTGSLTLSDFLDHKMPSDLKSIYCMLHVSYAMSQSTTQTKDTYMTDSQFSQSAAAWKGCLPVVSDSGVREQDIFDELLDIMWSEIKEGWEAIVEWMESAGIQETANDPAASADFDLPTLGVFDTDDPGWAGIHDSLFSAVDEGWINPDLGISNLHANEPKAIPPDSFSPLATPVPSNREPIPPAALSWDFLAEGLVISVALSFLQELESAGLIILCLFGSLNLSLLSTVFPENDTALPHGHESSDHGISGEERQNIVNSLQGSLDLPAYPCASTIIAKSSHLFLDGCLAGLEDLEACMIAFLRVLCRPSHSFLNFLSAITMHFNHYYHTKLPAPLKCTYDVYDNPNYVWDRIREESKKAFGSSDFESSASSCSPDSSTSTTTPSAHSETMEKPPKKRELEEASLSENTAPKKRRVVPKTTEQTPEIGKAFKFKVVTGNPAAKKRKKVLPHLPRASYPIV